MKRTKKFVLAILVMSIFAISALTVHAAVQWSYLITMAADMDFDDNNIVSIEVMSDADDRDADKMTLKCELQQYNGSWKTIKTWTETENDSSIWYSKEYAVTKNYSYRIKLTASAYKDSILLERVTDYFEEQFYR